MILKALMDIGAQYAGATTLHCNQQPIVGRVILLGNGKFALTPAEKNVQEYGPHIRGTSSLKPGIGFYKWEHLLACACVNADKRGGKAGNAEGGLIDDAKNAANLNTLLAFTERFLRNCDTPGLRDALEAIQRLQDSAVRDALRAEAIRLKLVGGQFVTLELGLETPQWFQHPELLVYWGKEGFALSDKWGKQKENKPKPSEEDAECGICLVTGQHSRLQRTAIALDGWKEKPRIAAFNNAAYRSRGLTQTFNAPMSVEAADLISKGWQYLVRREGENTPNSYKLEDQIFVFWGDPLIEVWGERARDPEVWKAIFLSAQKEDRKYTAPDGFHMIGVGKHTSNAYIISYLDQDAAQIADAVVRWGKWLTVRTDQTQYYSLTDLLMALRPRKARYQRVNGGKNLLNKHEMRLWRNLLHLSYGNGSIPPYIMHRLVERFATELEPYPLDRLVLLNLCLCSLNNLKEFTVDVFEGMESPKRNAFYTGRLFRAICDTQEKALGETGKTMLASNSRLASTRPVHVLPEMIRRYNSVYLPKLRRDNKAVAENLDGRVKWLVNSIGEFATSFNAEQAGWFWKGFYYYPPKKTTDDSKQGEEK